MHQCQMLALLCNQPISNPPNELEGFCYPRFNEECVLQVNGKWSDEKFRFVKTHFPLLTTEEVEMSLKNMFDNSKHLFSEPWTT